MRNCITIIFLAFFATSSFSQEILYEKQDSIFIEGIIEEMSAKEFSNSGKLLLAIADKFAGCRYVAGTLENGEKEPLYVSCSKLDCTTFVELTLAIATTIEKKEGRFNDVCKNLEKIRYRNGERKGYASRLHYISQWIEDSLKLGAIKEVTSCRISTKGRLHLSFMSSHPQNYTMLKGNSETTREIEAMEKPFRNKEVEYIPKEKLNKGADELPIRDGDILALTTNIDGLDVTHIGFAFWHKGRVHLLHASSSKEMVIRDNTTLYDYQKKRKSQTGIRIFRLIGTL